MFPGTLGASLLGILLTSKRLKWSNIPERVVMRPGEGIMATNQGLGNIRARQDF